MSTIGQSTLSPPIQVEVGQLCNVMTSPHAPMVRLVTKAGWENYKGGLWYRWEWVPDNSGWKPGDFNDCGYSALRMREAA